MNNRIAEDLPSYFEALGLQSIQINDSSEHYVSPQAKQDQRMKIFKEKISIWAKVARSTQVQEEGYISEKDRLQAIEDYLQGVDQDARLMIMKLKEVRGVKR